MASLYLEEDIITTLANVFSMATRRGCNYRTIESLIAKSKPFLDLEKGNDSIFYSDESGHIAENILGIKSDERDEYYLDIYRWVAEGYLYLFEYYRKSFEYLFLYLPLDEMERLYPLYHEMDWSQLFEAFEDRTKQKRLLSILIKNKNLSLHKLSMLSGVNYNTIEKYTKSDDNLYNASYSSIMAINNVLKCNPNTFLKTLFIEKEELDINVNEINSKLGLYFASLVDSDLSKKDFKYDKKLDIYRYADLSLIVVHQNSKTNYRLIGNKSKTILVFLQNYENVDELDNYHSVYFLENDVMKKRNSYKKMHIYSDIKELAKNKIGKSE